MNMKRILETLTVSFVVMLLAAGPSLAQSGELRSKEVPIITSTPAVRSPLLKEPPKLTPEELQRLEEALKGTHVPTPTPVDPTVPPETIQPTSPETVPNLPSKPQGESAAPAAPGTFALYRNSALSVPSTLTTSTTNEPSLGANGRVIFWTGNWYAAVSGDRGQTFSYINPSTRFPAVNGGFCCDQIVYYERTRGATFWLLQYQPDNNTNTQRLAVARSQADIVNNNWITYDFTPADFGFTTPPAGASGFWLDFPDLATSDNFLYQTTNVFPRILPNPMNQCAGTCPTQTCPAACGGNCTNVCSSVGAVINRLPLDELVQGQIRNGRFFSDANFSYRCTQGAQATMYWGSHNSNTQIRIYRWDETSVNPAADNVDHPAYNTGTMTARSPDGNDFAAFADSRILGAWVANGVIGFMWNAAQSTPPATSFPFPHVQVLRFNENNRSFLDRGQVFNSNFAFLYPSVHPNDRGHLGGTMAWGGGTTNYPNALAWIADDFNNGTITPLENVTFATGNSGPATNRWGDYLTTRRNVPYGNTWVGSGYSLVGGTGNANVVPRFVWFGRERDTPPPTNTIFVGLGNTSGYEDGSFAHPYNTVTKGHFAAMPGDTILIGTGNYPETLTFSTPVRVDRLFGPVTIGR